MFARKEAAPQGPTEDLAQLDIEELGAAMRELQAHINAAQARLCEMVAEVDRRGDAAGFHSTAHHLSYHCGLTPAAARAHVSVARAMETHSLIGAAFTRGELSLSKVAAMARVAPYCDEATLIDVARDATAEQFTAIASRITRAVADAGLRAASSERDHLSCSYEADGGFVLRARMGGLEGRVFQQALARHRHQLRAEDPTATNLDALIELAHHGLTCEAQGAASPVFQVVIHADADVLSGESTDGRCEIADGPGIAPETARRAACDADLVTMIHRDGRPVDAGRSTRQINKRLRRALEAMQSCCGFPGCGRAARHNHHIRHWVHHGPTDRDNLVRVCWFHHRLLHEGGYRIEDRDGERTFITPRGHPIPHAPPPTEGDAGALRAANTQAGLTLTDTTTECRYDGMPVDHGYVAEMVTMDAWPWNTRPQST